MLSSNDGKGELWAAHFADAVAEHVFPVLSVTAVLAVDKLALRVRVKDRNVR